LNDGGAARQFGWGRFKPELGAVNDVKQVNLAPQLFGEIRGLRIYDRRLRVSEAVGAFPKRSAGDVQLMLRSLSGASNITE